MDYSPPGSPVHGTFLARILEWFTISFSRVSSWSRDRTCVSCNFCIGRQILYHWAIWETCESENEIVQSCLTLCDPMDCSLPGFSIHGILQARILEWVTISFSRGSSRPRDRTRVSRIGGRLSNLWATREALVCIHTHCVYVYIILHGLPRWLSGKESACQHRRFGFNPWVGKIPWRRKW